MPDQIPLHELNKHLFAALLPETHGEARDEAPKKRTKKDAAPEVTDTPAE